MDPFIEGTWWTGFHAQFCIEIARQLTPKLQPKYMAWTEKRFVLATIPEEASDPQDVESFLPDTAVVVGAAARGKMARAGQEVSPAPLRLTTIIPEPIPHMTVEIRRVEENTLVTVIELLSRTNKRSDGRAEYLKRRQKLLLGRAHLMEIDLVRTGERVPMRQPLPSVPYFVFLTRVESRPATEVWPVPLRAHLPTVPVPLLAGDPDVPLDLQAAFTSVYDSFGYANFVRYDRALRPPLPSEDWEWASGLLRASDKC